MRRIGAGAMWISVVGVVLVCGAAFARQAPAPSDPAKRFIGTWRLVSIEGGTLSSNLGDHPTGVIYYDATGHMAAQIMTDRPRPTWTGSPTPEQARDTLRGYVAYFGTYTIDERAGTVTHHRAGMLTPGAVDFVRKYEFVAGDRLILTPVGGTQATHLTWERFK
jgi:lipocalin-like protein